MVICLEVGEGGFGVIIRPGFFLRTKLMERVKSEFYFKLVSILPFAFGLELATYIDISGDENVGEETIGDEVNEEVVGDVGTEFPDPYELNRW